LAPTTLAARFGQVQREGIERASAQITARALAALPVAERARILSGPVTIDLDAKDIEVFSRRGQGRGEDRGPRRPVPTRRAALGAAMAGGGRRARR
jgi:hypothetical protein